MLKTSYSMINFKMERSSDRYFKTRIMLQIECIIPNVDLMYIELTNSSPLQVILETYNLNIEDILIDNLIGLS